MLTYVALAKDNPYYKKTQSLYNAAFPEEERPPFDMTMDFKDNVMYAIMDKDVYVGLADLSFYEDLVYLFFLAIDPAHRSKGYGSMILKNLAEQYGDKRLYLTIETMDPKAPNYEQRLRRLAFYERNGFHPVGGSFVEYNVVYDLLTYKGVLVTDKEHFKLMGHLLGEKIARIYYPQAFED